ncbi:glycogen operon protein [Aeromonas sp. BIGb0405]|jgi:isoamylase|uniref:glycogen debranching protein GlgX n=1 Tax=unclassified Aeromonas TaxID=257493 RepID=UPI00286E7480|nr:MULTISPECIES: glycogen debranching protein GlgX [unclassified Aeromonas]MCS3457444.1 glycogen operon protein [Aeromonas sp. BIGb0405]MCS3461396.1 glycogen operon protein [Aeromonas sp. BIGb0445]
MVNIEKGSGQRLGAWLDETGCQFCVWAPQAERVELCLYDEQEQETACLVLPGQRGQYRFGHVSGIGAGQRYGYRLYGEPQDGLLFDGDKLLIDPYARGLSRPLRWDAESYEGDSAAMQAKSVVVRDDFDWQGVTKPTISPAQTLIYEAHVKGFTKLHPAIPEAERGTYLGLCHPLMLTHLKSLGISSLQLMPVAAFMAEPRLEDLGLTNYWGYNPVAFFAPEPRYAVRDAVTEFKTMVRELHRAGIEVILDVVYNHTAESGFDGPVLSFKGLDNSGYYSFEPGAHGPDFNRYANVTGCGNSVNLDHPNSLRLVLDALRYWVTEMQVDGFRFDLAVTLGREAGEFEPMGAFFKALLADPVLAGVKLIAEPWDIGPFGYRLGQFPSQWQEINDRYRDTVRAFWRGDGGKMADLATRLMGSRDLFPKNWRSPHTSINYLCYHDGFTLEDLVSYNQRHNQANGEDNRDGHGNNLSSNHGVEGPTLDPRISSLRLQQKRNLIATLLLSQGTPHFLGGDEMGRSQLGNNNAYCQDNQISWVNWQWRPEDERLLAFTRQMVALRASSEVFSNLRLCDDSWNGAQEHCHRVDWYHPDGHPLTDQDWQAPMGQAFAMDIGSLDEEGERWLVLFNASGYDIQFRLPPPGEGMEWVQTIDTATNDGLPFLPDDIKRQVAVGRAHALKLLERVSPPLDPVGHHAP